MKEQKLTEWLVADMVVEALVAHGWRPWMIEPLGGDEAWFTDDRAVMVTKAEELGAGRMKFLLAPQPDGRKAVGVLSFGFGEDGEAEDPLGVVWADHPDSPFGLIVRGQLDALAPATPAVSDVKVPTARRGDVTVRLANRQDHTVWVSAVGSAVNVSWPGAKGPTKPAQAQAFAALLQAAAGLGDKLVEIAARLPDEWTIANADRATGLVLEALEDAGHLDRS